MTKKKLSQGVVHKVPADLYNKLTSKPKVLTVWEDITPLARNEWICWIESAKLSDTRDRRMRILTENLLVGKRRPCCWVGCIHR